MFKFLRERKKDNKGFTLVELVIVIAILAILVGILAPQYTKYVEKSRKSADVNNMDELIKAVEVYEIDHASKNAITAKTITITMSKTAKITAKAANATADDTDVIAAFNEYVKNWENIRLKSSWTNGTATATIEISADGGVKVTEYTPDTFATYTQKGEEN